jgi:hypothetical protein
MVELPLPSKTAEDEIFNKKKVNQPRANKVGDSGNLNDNRRITRSRTRMLQEQASAFATKYQLDKENIEKTSVAAITCSCIGKLFPNEFRFQLFS